LCCARAVPAPPRAVPGQDGLATPAGFWFLVFGFWFLVFGFWFLVFDF